MAKIARIARAGGELGLGPRPPARPSTGVGGTVQAFVKPESVLARTAQEVLAAHTGSAGMPCPACGAVVPCPAGRSAAEVVEAAGLAELSGLVDAARQGRGPEVG